VSNDDIKDLLQIFLDSGVAEMEVKRGDNSLRLRRSMGPAPTTEYVLPPMMAHQQAAFAPQPSHSGAASASPALPQPVSNETIVKSPIVGTYYDSPKPGDPSSKWATRWSLARCCASSSP
jgi:acetyl-CoA carboxylase biotin carboxyl carrier protein